MNMTRGILAATCFVALLGGSAKAETMSIHVRNTIDYKAQLEFNSEVRGHEWPGGGEAYTLDDYSVHNYLIQCRSGEKICYSAWIPGHAEYYWGDGADHDQSCDSCCFICGNGPVSYVLK